MNNGLADIQDPLLEKQILGQLMVSSPTQVREVRELITDSCFYTQYHQMIWDAICTINDRGEENDLVKVVAEMRQKPNFDAQEIADISTHILNSATEFRTRCALLSEYDKRRKSYELAVSLQNASIVGGGEFAEILDKTKETITDIQTNASNDQTHSFRDALVELTEQVNDILNGKNKPGIETGFSEIDKRGGFLLGDLVVIAAKSSIGKTTMALSLAYNMAGQGNGGAIYSMEMSRIKLTARLLASQCGINSNRILSQALDPNEITRFDKAINELYKLPIYFDDRNRSSIDSIINSIHRLKVKRNIMWAIVDYIQILPLSSTKSKSEEQVLGEIARKLKNTAEELQIPIIALSQLNRDSEDKPRKDRMRGSGQIEEAADTVILLYRPCMNERSAKKYDYPYESVSIDGTCLVDVCKGRNSGIYDFICGFDADNSKFYELTRLPQATQQEQETRQVTKENEDLPF